MRTPHTRALLTPARTTFAAACPWQQYPLALPPHAPAACRVSASAPHCTHYPDRTPPHAARCHLPHHPHARVLPHCRCHRTLVPIASSYTCCTATSRDTLTPGSAHCYLLQHAADAQQQRAGLPFITTLPRFSRHFWFILSRTLPTDSLRQAVAAPRAPPVSDYLYRYLLRIRGFAKTHTGLLQANSKTLFLHQR